jgi:hypothetical protein
MTTRSTPGAPWNDERLAAAFAARAARAGTPDDLPSVTGTALRTQPTSAPAWRRLLAPAAVLILAIGAVGGVALLGGQRGSNGPFEPSTDPSTSPSPSDEWAGREAMGLPIISVGDAIAIRDAGIDDREIAVHGWFWPVAPIPCTLSPLTSLQPVCLDQYVVLMAGPEVLGTGGSSGYSGARPTGPSFQIDLDDLDNAWQPALPASQPVEIAVVGHFDDHGSTSCSAEQQNACRDRFVVDRVDSVNDETLPTSIVDYLEGTGSPFDDAQAIIDAVRPGVTVLSAAHAIGGFDPRRTDHAFDDPARWIVRVLDQGVLATYMVVDSTGSIYQLTADGPVLVALSTPGERVTPSPSPVPKPSPAWGPWPPKDAFSVMEFKDDTGRKAFAAIVDASGLLTSVAEGVPDAAIGDGALEGFFRDPSGTHRYRLRWTTTICDREMTVSIAREVARIVIEHAPREGCDAMGIGRDLVLQFTQDVDPAAVELQVIQPALLPEPPPEPTTMVVELDRGESIESVLVIDHAASLMEARAANPIPNIPDFTGVRIVRAEDGGTIVMWDGLLCDRDLWISIEADDPGPPDWIGVHGTRAETCRMARVWRAIWLDLGPVDVASIGAQMAVAPRTEAKRDPGPIIGVAEALVVRSHPADDHQLQVRGWYWRDPVVYDCSVPPSPPPALESGCQGPHDRFVADPDDLTGAGFTVWLRPGVDRAMLRFGDPSQVVIVGHFADTLSEACAASTREMCRDIFVIEEVLAEPAT